jgi:hypothetical protein
LEKFHTTALDKCDENLVENKTTTTVGNHLCEQVSIYLRYYPEKRVTELFILVIIVRVL